MERYIKYKRFVECLTPTGIQVFFDDLVKEGWDILYYREKLCGEKQNEIRLHSVDNEDFFNIIVVAGKRQLADLK